MGSRQLEKSGKFFSLETVHSDLNQIIDHLCDRYDLARRTSEEMIYEVLLGLREPVLSH
jgi:hypothetical protein